MTREQFGRKVAVKNGFNEIQIYPFSDGSIPGNMLNTGGFPFNYNGASWDRVRNNNQGTLLASAARTASINSPTQTNHNAKGIIVFLNVTAVSGTGGLVVRITGQDPANPSVFYTLNTVPAAVTATGGKAYVLYPGVTTVGGDVTQVNSAVLPRTFQVSVIHVDSSSYTYSVGYQLIL
jgi:hypothetical protein